MKKEAKNDKEVFKLLFQEYPSLSKFQHQLWYLWKMRRRAWIKATKKHFYGRSK